MDYPRLIADIGGTNARFAIETEAFELSHIEALPCASYDTLLSAITAYLTKHQLPLPKHVAIAIANPVNGDTIKMTNHHWAFSIRSMKAELGVETLLLLNDFTAQALAITQMQAMHLEHLNGPKLDNPIPCHHACAVVGPGTGLGVSGLIPDGRGSMLALAGEGGHATFSPANKIERDLMDYVVTLIGDDHISTERLLQGEGLLRIYDFVAEQQNATKCKLSPAEVTHGALTEKDPLCLAALNHYCAILGGLCADVALTLGAVGGVYISGGIIPRFTDFVRQSPFRQRFEAKGRFKDYLARIPVYVVEHETPGLLGAAVALNNQLN